MFLGKGLTPRPQHEVLQSLVFLSLFGICGFLLSGLFRLVFKVVISNPVAQFFLTHLAKHDPHGDVEVTRQGEDEL